MNTTHEPLSVDALLARARREAGFDNFGSFAFLPALGKLVESINGILDNFHDRGRKGIEDRLIRMLVNRLRMQRDVERHPEILAEELLPPASIIGLPRTGSTKLQRLLAAGGGFQEPLMWQVYNQAPFPDAVPGRRDPRIQAAVDYVRWLSADAAEGFKGHPLIVEEAEEEGMLLEQTLDSIQTISFVPAYPWVRYIERIDKTEMFLYLRRCLQYLQWQFHHDSPKPWLLKHPPNLGYETYLGRTFPGMRFVVTHRDPYPVLASVTELTTAVQLLFCKGRDVRKFSRWAIDEFASEMERHLAWRDANPGVEVLDISFKEIVKNGLEVARRTYDYFDLPWSADTASRISRWLEEDAKQHERLEWNYADMDFTEAECRERFADYYRRFAGYL